MIEENQVDDRCGHHHHSHDYVNGNCTGPSPENSLDMAIVIVVVIYYCIYIAYLHHLFKSTEGIFFATKV